MSLADSKDRGGGGKKAEVASYPTVRKRLKSLRPSPENASLYREVDASDPEIIKLAASIRRLGLREPLVVTSDNYIVSGHRR